MRSAIPILRATLVTGYEADGCGPWADGNEKGAFSDLMSRVWMDVAERAGRKAGRREAEVAEEPTMYEAKKVGSDGSKSTLLVYSY